MTLQEKQASVADILSTIEAERATSQGTYFDSNGKYEYIAEQTTSDDDLVYNIDEYTTTSGFGYLINFKLSFESKEYIKSHDAGNAGCGCDWHEIINLI